MPEASGGQGCSRCGAGVTTDDLGQGLAVRIGKDVICAACIDVLPRDTQLRINQLRAMRGLDSTTYLVRPSKHPNRVHYTFSTAANILRHRRSLKESGRFDAPPLPPKDKAPSANRGPNRPTRAARTESNPAVGGGTPVGLYIGIGAGAAALLIAIAVIALPGKPPPTPAQTPETTQQPPELDVDVDRFLAMDPRPAWDAANELLPPNHEVRERLGRRLADEKRSDLNAAEGDIAAFNFSAARRHLDRNPLPTDLRFNSLRRQEQSLRQRLENQERAEVEDRTASDEGLADRASEPEPSTSPEAPLDVAKAETDDSQSSGLPFSASAADDDALEGQPSNLFADTSEDDPIPGMTDDGPETTPESDAEEEGGFGQFGENANSDPEPGTNEDAPLFGDEPKPPAGPARVAGPWHGIDLVAEFRQPGDDWERSDTSLRLAKDQGELHGTLTAPEGDWEVWAEIRAPEAEPGRQLAVHFGLDTFEQDLSAAIGHRYTWVRIGDKELATVAATEGALVIHASGNDLGIRGLRFTAAGWDPALAKEAGSAGSKLSIAPAPAPPKASRELVLWTPADRRQQMVSLWDDRLPIRGEDPGDGLTKKREEAVFGRNGPLETIGAYMLQAPNLNGRRVISINSAPTAPFSIQDGGLVLRLNGNSSRDRKGSIILIDDRSLRSSKMEITLPGKGWHWIVVDTQDLPAPITDARQRATGFNPGRIKRVDVEVDGSFTFFLAEVVAVSGREAKPEDGPVEPVILRNTRNALLEKIITTKLGPFKKQRYKSKQALEKFEPWHFQVLVGNGLRPGWRTKARSGLQALADEYAEKAGDRDAPKGRIVELLMHDQWLNGKLIDAKTAENLQNDGIHLVIITTAGVEVSTGLNTQQALINFWDKAIVEALEVGALPVVTLGPSKLPGGQQGDADAIWSALLTHLEKKHPGIPVFDLRHIAVDQDSSFASGMVQESIDAMEMGLRQLLYRIDLVKTLGAGRRR